MTGHPSSMRTMLAVGPPKMPDGPPAQMPSTSPPLPASAMTIVPSADHVNPRGLVSPDTTTVAGCGAGDGLAAAAATVRLTVQRNAAAATVVTWRVTWCFIAHSSTRRDHAMPRGHPEAAAPDRFDSLRVHLPCWKRRNRRHRGKDDT